MASLINTTVRPRAALGVTALQLPTVVRRSRPARAMRIISQARAGKEAPEDSKKLDSKMPGMASEEEIRKHDKSASYLSLTLSGGMDTSMFYMAFIVFMFFPIVLLPFLMPAIRAAGY